MSYYIGIDLGTSSCKLLLVDEGGAVLNEVTKEYPLSFPHPGWSEQAPEDWWSAVTQGIPELLRRFDAAQVAGIGAGGQMHGLVALDENDKVIRPAILWNDGRTAKEVDYLNNEIGRDKLSQYTANIAFAGFTAPKLLWMRKNEPDSFAQIKKVMLPKDYINYKLTGFHCTDYSDASGMLLEYHRDSEFNVGTGDFILLLAKQEEVVNGTLDTAKVKAFRVPAGVLVEVYATTLHYAPCHTNEAEGFRVAVVLPRGTNTEKPKLTAGCGDSKLLWARNKWLLAHPDSDEAKQGAYVGLNGENIAMDAR